MKKLITLFLITSASLFASAQNIDPAVKEKSSLLKQLGENEIRFNVPMAIAGLPELSYERFVADNMGIGFSAAISAEKYDKMPMRCYIMPYYRLYFGEKKASGVFIEGNLGMFNQKGYVLSNDTTLQHITNLGFGAAVGLKLLARNGFIGELTAGAGRIFGSTINKRKVDNRNQDYYSYGERNFYLRLGITLGKRF